MVVRCMYWEALFRLLYLPLDHLEPIFIENLKNPNNYVVRAILRIYSLETWLPNEINKATRHKDKSKIDTLGPFACVLSYILQLQGRFETIE